MLLAATSSCSGAFQPLPVVLLLPAMWWLFQTYSLPPCLEVVFWAFLPWQTAQIRALGASLVQSGAVCMGSDFAVPRL